MQGKKVAKEAKKTIDAKKRDVTGANDKPVVAETTRVSEIVEDEGDEDDKKGTRRRVRRET